MTDDTITVEVIGPQFRYEREQYVQGDELEVTERTLESHPNTLAPVAGDGGASDDNADQEDVDVDPVAEADLDPHPSDLTVDDLEARIDDVDDLSLLYGIRAAEADDKNRETALEAIDAQIASVEG
ncbi:hypothetical protein [Halobacterium salinarum]|uniref:hypothetical protein n=1 Tax=Halobacterium salinarum TaxID=2242 RepID=UPI0025572C99|nr:hypothetical protein [Halobacterium salinarum]MDL0133516.1 hypothetical protein [Halobacterium salinarum]